MRLIALNSLSYLVYFAKISKQSAIVARSYAQLEPCIINEIENERGPDLEIWKFSDHDPDLFLISRKFLIDWYIIYIGLSPKKFFSPAKAWQNAKSAIMENWPRPKTWTKIFFHLYITPERDQKSNRVRKALHTQSHSDPRVYQSKLFLYQNNSKI